MKKLYLVNVSLHATVLVAAEDSEEAEEIAADNADDALAASEVDVDISREIHSSTCRLPTSFSPTTPVYAAEEAAENGWELKQHLAVLDEAKKQRVQQLNLFNGKPKNAAEA